MELVRAYGTLLHLVMARGRALARLKVRDALGPAVSGRAQDIRNWRLAVV